MAVGKTNAGGGGGGLNFDVKDFRTEAELLASAGKENRIGVVTPIPMTGWRFDANQPEDLQDGEVWFSVGNSSDVEFNALKKNGLKLYPLIANQRVAGTLTYVPAKSYISGEWVHWWDGSLYDAGNEYTEITGGWSGSGYTIKDGTNTGNVHSGAKGADYLEVSYATGFNFSIQGTQKPIDFSNKSTLEVTLQFVSGAADFYVVVSQSKNISLRETTPFTRITSSSTTVASVDISSVQSGYVSIIPHSNGTKPPKCRIKKVRCF